MNTQNKYNVLVIDGDGNTALSYSEILGSQYTVRIVSSGIKAIDLVNAHEDIEIVLLDYKLSDLSGLDVLKKIKEIRPELPVLIVTGYGNEELAVKSFRYGALDYLKKPFCFNELSEKMAFYLSLERQYKQPVSFLYREQGAENWIDHSTIGEGNSYKIQKAIRFIHENFTEDAATLAMAAEKACMSKRHFCRIFKKAVGTTYQDYISRCRIKKAKGLLSVKYSVTEVAFAVGFSDLTHFGRVFKKIVGRTPSQYRCDRSSIVFYNQ
jgi:YesN/AraC family two-component response regulator